MKYKIRFERNLSRTQENAQLYKINRTEIIFTRFEYNGAQGTKISFIKNGGNKVTPETIDYVLNYFGFDRHKTAKYEEKWLDSSSDSTVDVLTFEQTLNENLI